MTIKKDTIYGWLMLIVAGIVLTVAGSYLYNYEEVKRPVVTNHIYGGSYTVERTHPCRVPLVFMAAVAALGLGIIGLNCIVDS